MNKWSTKKLGALVEEVIDYRGKTPPFSTSGIPCISAANVKNGSIKIGPKFITRDNYEKWTTRGFIKPGDVLMTTEAPVGEVAQVPSDQTYLITRRVIAFQVDPYKADEKFLKYSLIAQQNKDRLSIIAHGATVPRLYKDDILEFEILIPHLYIQKKIAAILSTYDDLIENNNQRIALLERAAEAIYREWFVRMRFPGWETAKFEKGIPEGWEVTKLGELTEFAYGKSLRSDTRIPGNYPVYGSGGIVGTHEKALVKGPGIIVGRKGNVGSVYYSSRDFYPIDTVYYVKSSVDFRYLYYLLQSLNFINNDAAVPGLNRTQALSNKFFLPPDDLRAKFDKTCELLFGHKESHETRNDLLIQSRDLLLARLISGKLPVDTLDIHFPPSMIAA